MTTLRLRLRTWLGWGYHPEELRMLGKLGLRFIILALFLCLIIFVGIEIDFAARVHRLGVVSILLSPLVPSISIFAAGICLWFGLPTVAYWNLARRAVSDVLRITQGRCFEVLPAPSIYLFARIGPTSESAAWYPLPIEWETVVMPSEDTYEVEYLPTSGWVHRVRRFGASPREVVQRAPSEVNDGAHAAAVEEEVEAQPTAEEQRELRRYARRVWRLWGESAASIAASGWSLIVLGVVAGHGMVAAFLWLSAIRPVRPGDETGIALLLAGCMAVGSGFIGWGVWCFRLWGRVRRAAQQGALSVEGDVMSWLPRNQDRETIVKVRADDGETKILRVRRLFNHRVRRVGARVRIDYMPVSEYVTDVQYVGARARIS